ncbi:uncharacterized protein LOC142579071 isoform X2 [Dermacentor variabilis]|uniref:uncharacterized protein LOC142579071 isoform X2 n=1 Tax=Dermacentor variabilis TaxID=34621 RepID=UPI003F5C17C1
MAKGQVRLCDRRPYYIRPPAKERVSARPRTCPESNRLQASWPATGGTTSSPSRERGAAGDSSRQRRRRTTGAGSVWWIGRFRELPDAPAGTRSRSSDGAEARPWRRSHHHWPALWFVQMSAVVVSLVVAALVVLRFVLQEARMATERAHALNCFLDGDDDGDDDGDAEGANGVSSVAATRRRQAPDEVKVCFPGADHIPFWGRREGEAMPAPEHYCHSTLPVRRGLGLAVQRRRLPCSVASRANRADSEDAGPQAQAMFGGLGVSLSFPMHQAPFLDPSQTETTGRVGGSASIVLPCGSRKCLQSARSSWQLCWH